MVRCPVCKEGKLRFSREEERRPLHSLKCNYETEIIKEKIYVCTNCKAEIFEEDFKTLQEEESAQK
jgi:hypothetical protein